ncbi:MAG: helix-turn-helix transcriptional regulator [Bacteroidota bacterium]
MNYSEIYQRLRETYSDREIAESMLIPEELSEAERIEADRELLAYRMKLMREMSEEDQILSDVMRLRFQMETYVKASPFSFDKTFGKQVKEYLRITKRTQQQLAGELSIHHSKLSRIINDKEEPNVELCYRLEKHTGGLIQALTWWRLAVKKQEFIIAADEQRREVEQAKVTNYLKAS